MVLVFSFLLILGIILGQCLEVAAWSTALVFSGSVCLAYIMFEVGLEFATEKHSVKSYGLDILIASTAALLPALLWFGYFLLFVNSPWKTSLLSGLSCAPTSAGVLFSMMMAAGLSAGWVFKKARVLAVLDDLVTILLLTPLQIIIYGFEWKSIVSLFIISGLLFGAFRWQNSARWPLNHLSRLVYAIVLAVIVYVVENTAHLHVGVLIPAFVLGCLLRPPAHAPVGSHTVSLDALIKGLFMLLVGLTFPKITMGGTTLAQTTGHVVVLSILANLGKFFLVFCYKNEATLKERMALGVAMFPRGEVGAAVLLIGIGYGLGGYANTLAILSLALNLMLTGIFISIVIHLLKK